MQHFYFTYSVIHFLEESVGFEPTDAFTSPVFKTGSFDRSDSSPFLATDFIIAKKYCIVNTFL